MNFKVLTKMFKLRKKDRKFPAPSVHFGDVARGPQGVTPIEARDVGASLMMESG